MMYVKRSLIILAILAALLVAGCGDDLTVDGRTYETYGLLNQDEEKSPSLHYDVIWGNVIWGCILAETVIAPVYFFGFSIFEPTGKKENAQ